MTVADKRTVRNYTDKEIKNLVDKAVDSIHASVDNADVYKIRDLEYRDYLKIKDMLEITINNNLRSTAGRFIERRDGSEYKLELHHELGEDRIFKIIEHEVFHMMTGEPDTRKFKRWCNALGIITKHSIEFDSEESDKYKLICKKCEDIFAKRKRKSKVIKNPNKYRSGCCSAKIKVETI